MKLPVNGKIVSCFVGNFDNKGVSRIHLYGWSREHPIYCNGVVSLTQPLYFCCLNLLHHKNVNDYLQETNQRNINRIAQDYIERTYNKVMMVNFSIS